MMVELLLKLTIPQRLVIQKERPLYVQLVLPFAATEESQRGNDCGVGLLYLVVKTFSDYNFFSFLFCLHKKDTKSVPIIIGTGKRSDQL